MFSIFPLLKVVELWQLFYAAELPSEDEKLKGPCVVHEHKVTVEKGSFCVLWCFVDERNGNLKEAYF